MTIKVPGDKSISHRAAILAGLADGQSEITGFLASEDCLATATAVRALGATVEFLNGDKTALKITGTGMALVEPMERIDCGNSGTTMRLLSGVLAAQPFRSELCGDQSLSRRPMKRVIDPLGQMGGTVTGQGEKGTPPLTIAGAEPVPVRYELPVASAQVKSAVLLAGLFADGTTTVIEPTPTRDHTERMLKVFGAGTERDGNAISITGGQSLQGSDFYVPGDISSAAFWIVAAAARPGADLTVEGVGLNPTRTGVLDVLRRMGARIETASSGGDLTEPYGSVRVRGTQLRGTEIRGAEIANVIDELPVLAVAGALAEGVTRIGDAAELRVKESDRIAAVAGNLLKMGASVEELPDGMEICGGQPLQGTVLESFGDHRIAMAFTVAGLFAGGETVLENTACVDTSYPGFEQVLTGLLAAPVS